MTPYLILVDYVDCSDKSGLFVDYFPKFVELVLLQAGRKHLVLLLDGALNLFDEVHLFELNLVLLLQYFDGALI